MKLSKAHFFSKKRSFSNKQAYVLLEALFCLGIFAFGLYLFALWIQEPLEGYVSPSFAFEKTQTKEVNLILNHQLPLASKLHIFHTSEGQFFFYE